MVRLGRQKIPIGGGGGVAVNPRQALGARPLEREVGILGAHCGKEDLPLLEALHVAFLVFGLLRVRRTSCINGEALAEQQVPEPTLRGGFDRPTATVKK